MTESFCFYERVTLYFRLFNSILFNFLLSYSDIEEEKVVQDEKSNFGINKSRRNIKKKDVKDKIKSKEEEKFSSSFSKSKLLQSGISYSEESEDESQTTVRFLNLS